MVGLVSLPMMAGTLEAVIIGAGGLAIGIAAQRTDSRWERLFAAGFGMFVVWAAYFSAVQTSNLTDAYHAYVFFVLLSIGLALGVASFASAPTLPARAASSAITIFLGIVWWEALRSVACDNIVRFECANRLGNLAARGIPDWLSFILLVASVLLFVRASRGGTDQLPARWMATGFAAFVLHNATLAFRSMIGSGQLRPSTPWEIFELLIVAAAFVAWIAAARLRDRATTAILGAGLALFILPTVWSVLRVAID